MQWPINGGNMQIDDHGHHREKKEGEVFAGFLTVKQYQNGHFWDFERLGNPRGTHEMGERPWFLLEAEIWERGWVINRNKKV